MVNKCVLAESDSNLSFIGNWDTGPLPTERLEILRVKKRNRYQEKGDHSSDDKDGNMIITS